MRVLLVSNGYPPNAFGGVEVYTADLASALDSRGHVVSVLCAEGRADEADYEVLEENAAAIAVFRLNNNYRRTRSFADLFADARIEELFNRLLDRIQPDLIHFNHLIKLSARLPLIAATRGIPSLYTAHDFWALCQRIYLLDWRRQSCAGPVCGGQCSVCVSAATPLERARTFTISGLRRIVPFKARMQLRKVLARNDYFLPDLHTTPELLDERYELFREALMGTRRIVAPSQYVKQMFVNNGYRGEHIDVVPLGVTLPGNDASGKPGSAALLRFAFIGTILPLKGAEILLQAFMGAAGSNLRLTYYGREDILPAFSRKLRRHAARDDRVAFAGPFLPADRDRVYRDIDVLVIPSIAHESFSLVAREALGRGIPVIASDIGALPEVIRDGVNGFLTPPGDPQGLGAVIARLADDPGLLSNLQLPGPISILSAEQHFDRLLSIYDECRALPS